MAAMLLMESGHHQVAFVTGSHDTSTSLERERGFREELKKHGLEPYIEMGKFSYQGAFDAARRLMKLPKSPDAVFCANDIMAIGVLDALRHAEQKKVPEEVSVIGFDDIPMAAWPSYNLTTIRQPIERMIDYTVNDLLDRINQKTIVPKQELVRGDLVVRSSAKLPSGLSSGYVISTSETRNV